MGLLDKLFKKKAEEAAGGSETAPTDAAGGHDEAGSPDQLEGEPQLEPEVAGAEADLPFDVEELPDELGGAIVDAAEEEIVLGEADAEDYGFDEVESYLTPEQEEALDELHEGLELLCEVAQDSGAINAADEVWLKLWEFENWIFINTIDERGEAITPIGKVKGVPTLCVFTSPRLASEFAHAKGFVGADGSFQLWQVTPAEAIQVAISYGTAGVETFMFNPGTSYKFSCGVGDLPIIRARFLGDGGGGTTATGPESFNPHLFNRASRGDSTEELRRQAVENLRRLENWWVIFDRLSGEVAVQEQNGQNVGFAFPSQLQAEASLMMVGVTLGIDCEVREMSPTEYMQELAQGFTEVEGVVFDPLDNALVVDVAGLRGES
jgi:hypothetical protein